MLTAKAPREYTKEWAIRHILATACGAGLIFVFFMVLCRLTPAGWRSFLAFDMKTQYMDFYSFYKSILKGDAGIFYSLRMTLGSGVYGFFAYYLSSPLLLILALVPRAYLPEAVTLLCGLRYMLMAASADAFLISYIRRQQGNVLPHTAVFAYSYCFCACITAYSFNPMWMEVYALMPLCMLMLDKLIHEKKRIGYVLSLAFMLWCNYYMAYMVCIFIVLWTLSRIFRDRTDAAGKLLRVAACSVWGAALSAVLILPTFLELFGSPKDASLFDEQHKALSLAQALKNWHIFSFDWEQTWWGEPLIWCGMIIVLLLVLFIFSKKIGFREKLSMALMIVFFLISFMVPSLNLIWHAGMEPSGYPYRESFLLVFVLVICAARAWNVHREDVPKLVGPALAILQTAALLANAVYIFRQQTEFGMMSAAEYRASYYAELAAAEKMSDDGIYRAETMRPRSQNDALMYGYNGITHYSSAGLMSTRFFLKRLGFQDDGLYIAYGQDNTRTADVLLGVRYLLGARNRASYDLLWTGDYSLRENTAALSLASAVRKKPQEDADDPFTLQEEMMAALTGEEICIFARAERERVEEGIYHFTLLCDGDIFFYMNEDDQPRNLSVYVNGEFLSGYGNLNTQRVLNLGSGQAGESIEFMLKTDDGLPLPGEPLLVSEDTQALDRAAALAAERNAEVKELSSSKYEIVIPQLDDISGIYTTIPYEGEWRVYLNGKRIGTEAVYDSFLYIPLDGAEAGDVVSLSYIPAGLAAGAVISAAAMLGLIVYALAIRSSAARRIGESQ